MRYPTILVATACALVAVAMIANQWLIRDPFFIVALDSGETRTQLVEIDHQRQERTASTFMIFTETMMRLSYDNPISIDRSATVKATLSQRTLYSGGRDLSTPLSMSTETRPPEAAQNLEWPIEVTLDSGAFDFASGDKIKKVGQGAALPLTLVWTPVAKAIGKWDLTLKVDNLTGVKSQSLSMGSRPLAITINGEKQPAHFAETVVLSIDVTGERKFGMPAETYEAVKLLFIFGAFVFGTPHIYKALTKGGAKPAQANQMGKTSRASKQKKDKKRAGKK